MKTSTPRKLALVLVTLACLVWAQSQPLQDAQSAIRRKDYAIALGALRPLAENGDPAAQSMLGSMYALGLGLPQNFTESTNWYRKSAAQGFADD